MSHPKIIAHRGASADAPENTLAAFRLGLEQGADGIEGDFRLTRDGQIVCLHDADTGRTGDRKLLAAEAILAELRQVDVGTWKDPRFRGERIPTLAEVLAVVPPGKDVYLELKSGPEILPVLETALQTSRFDPQQITLISFDAAVVEAARRRLPQLRRLGVVEFKRGPQGVGWQPGVQSVVERLVEHGAAGLDAGGPPEVFTADLVRRLTAANLELHCWTIDDPAEARRLAALGVRAITSNRPAVLRQALDSAATGR